MHNREKRSKPQPKALITPVVMPVNVVENNNNVVIPQKPNIELVETYAKTVGRDDYNKRHNARGYDRNVKELHRRRKHSVDRNHCSCRCKTVGNCGVAKGKNPCCGYCNPAIGATRYSKYVANMDVTYRDDSNDEYVNDEE